MQRQTNPKRLSASGGFTLVEVIVSLFLMAIVFTAAFGAYFLGMRMVEDAREEVRASQIIQSELESLRKLNWAALSQYGALEPINPQGDLIKQFAKDYIAYRHVSTISPTQKRVIIYVWWVNSRGSYNSQIANTIFAKGGLNDYYYRKAS